MEKRFMPDSLIGWLTVITLTAGILASCYSGILKPYNTVRNLETKLVGIEKQIEFLQYDINRLMLKVYK